MRGQSSCAGPPPDPIANARWEAQEQLQAASEAAREHRIQTGSYAGLTAEVVHSINGALSGEPPALDTEPGPRAEPWRVAVLAVPHEADGARLCNTSTGAYSFCMTLVHGARWQFTALKGTIAETVKATDAGTAERW
jgi:hypothetical protein